MLLACSGAVLAFLLFWFYNTFNSNKKASPSSSSASPSNTPSPSSSSTSLSLVLKDDRPVLGCALPPPSPSSAPPASLFKSPDVIWDRLNHLLRHAPPSFRRATSAVMRSTELATRDRFRTLLSDPSLTPLKTVFKSAASSSSSPFDFERGLRNYMARQLKLAMSATSSSSSSFSPNSNSTTTTTTTLSLSPSNNSNSNPTLLLTNGTPNSPTTTTTVSVTRTSDHPDVVAVYSDNSVRPLEGVQEEASLMTYLFKDKGLVSLSTGGGDAVVDAAVVASAVSTYKPRGLHIASHSSANEIARGVERSAAPLDFVFLNTCLSDDTARVLVDSGKVRHVISWRSVISDAGAALFAKLFYESLPGYGWNVEKAYKRSVDALETELTSVGDPLSNSTVSSRAMRVGIPMLISASSKNDSFSPADASPSKDFPANAPTTTTTTTITSAPVPVPESNPEAVDEVETEADACPTCCATAESAVALKVETSSGVFRRARCCDLRGNFSTLCRLASPSSPSLSPSFEFLDEDGDRMLVCDDASLGDALDVARNTPRRVLKLTSTATAPTVPSKADLPPFKGVVSLDIIVNGTTLRRAGSGVMVNPKGVGITNWHVIAPLLQDAETSSPPTMRGVIGRVAAWDDRMTWTHTFTVLEYDEALDLAVFQVGSPVSVELLSWGTVSGTVSVSRRRETAPPVFDTVPVGVSADARPLDDLTVLGFPGIGGLSMTFTKACHGGIAVSPEGNKFIRFTASLNSGGSGGALVNTAGELVGIAAHTPQLPSSRRTRMADDKGVIHTVRLDFDPHAQPLNHAIPVDTVMTRFPSVLADCRR